MPYFEFEVFKAEDVFTPSPHPKTPKIRSVNAVIYVIF